MRYSIRLFNYPFILLKVNVRNTNRRNCCLYSSRFLNTKS
nr:MAG TPA: hypothetical protein [Bacteriophage sp.]